MSSPKQPKQKPKPFPIVSRRRLASLLGVPAEQLIRISRAAGRHYEPFDLFQEKKGGRNKWRHIDNPLTILKSVQRPISRRLLRRIVGKLPPGMVGGVAGKSIKENAAPHVRNEMVVGLDIRDCYPNTNNKRVLKVWREHLGCGEEVASTLTKLTTYQERLPQGAPTSPALCNLVLLPLYEDIQQYTQKNKLNFSLYVDDITISGDVQPALNAISDVIRLVQKHGYAVSQRKIEKMPSNIPQNVTGLNVNQQVSITNKTIRELRDELVALAKSTSRLSNRQQASIKGKIVFIRQYSEPKAERLTELYESLFENIEIFKADKQKKITRECRHARRHTNRSWRRN